ncbi:MAG: endoribonuclease MazF [Verrucomicrobia bacterium]|nr:endoribonuclease MazF [Verrucomicrobiota bacterium]
MAAYVPDRGDVVWINFSPQAGHEQAGRRPAVVLSPRSYNKPSGLALFCPITNRAKDYPFEANLPQNAPVTGVVLADQVRNLDWHARRVEFIGELDLETLADILARLRPLVELEDE